MLTDYTPRERQLFQAYRKKSVFLVMRAYKIMIIMYIDPMLLLSNQLLNPFLPLPPFRAL
jgi:hypothetical protein